MGTTADKLNKLLATKAGIKAALVEKGQPVSDSDTFASYEGKIRAIRTSDIQLASIVVTKQPTKTSYTAKESFNPAGMEVKAVFSNDAYKFVTDFTTEPSGALKPTDTKVKVKYTEFGVTAEADVAVTVAAIKLSVPTQSGAPVYTGSTITPAWSGYDSSLMSISGSTSGTNAGSYTAKFSLKDKVNYTWADGTTADKSVAWSIGKAQASITLDKTSVVLNGDKLSETVNISSVGMTSIMVMSSDMTVATASLNGNVLTISSVDETTGTAVIVINGEVDSNYNAPEYPAVNVTASFTAIITIQIFHFGGDVDSAKAIINGVEYYCGSAATGGSSTVQVAVGIGTVIQLYEYKGSYSGGSSNTWDYTVLRNTLISLVSVQSQVGPSSYASNGTVSITVEYGVFVVNDSNGTVSVGKNTAIADSVISFTVTPDNGYSYRGAVVSYTLNDVKQTIELDATIRDFTMPAADVTVTPKWGVNSLADDLVSLLIDFEYADNGDGTATLIAWNGTYNGEASTELIIPEDSRIVL